MEHSTVSLLESQQPRACGVPSHTKWSGKAGPVFELIHAQTGTLAPSPPAGAGSAGPKPGGTYRLIGPASGRSEAFRRCFAMRGGPESIRHHAIGAKRRGKEMASTAGLSRREHSRAKAVWDARAPDGERVHEKGPPIEYLGGPFAIRVPSARHGGPAKSDRDRTGLTHGDAVDRGISGRSEV